MSGVRSSVSIFRKLLEFPNTTARKISKQQHRWLDTMSVNSEPKKDVVYRARALVESDIPQLIEKRRRIDMYDPTSCFSINIKVNPGFIIMVEGPNGKIVACLSCYVNTDDLCVGGLHMADDDVRGFATKLMLPSYWKLLGNRNIVVNTEPTNLASIYRWFPVFETEMTIIEFESLQAADPAYLSSSLPPGVQIQHFQDYHLPAILEYDNNLVGYKRELEVSLTCQDTLSKTFVALKMEKCVGYGIIRFNIQGGGKVGPLYANDPETAESLLKALLVSCPEEWKMIAVAVVSNNVAALQLFGKFGKMRTINCQRCYGKERFIIDTKNVFAIFDLEFQPF